MAIRADLLVPRESHLIDRAGDPIAVARVSCIADNLVGAERLPPLAAPALREALAPVAQARAIGNIPLFLALPSFRRPGAGRAGRALIPELVRRAEVPIDIEASRTFSTGRAGGVEAVAAGMAALAEREAVVVGGVDSWFDPDALEHLDREMRLNSLTAENGFIPGEGGAFFVLTQRGSAGVRPLGRVESTAVEHEPRPYGSDEPCHALGMTKAAMRALEPCRAAGRAVPWVMTDVVDERHRVDEWAFASARIAKLLAPDYVHDQPGLVTGDVGAASVALMVAVAVTRWQTGCAVGPRLLIAAHSDESTRGALVVSAGS